MGSTLESITEAFIHEWAVRETSLFTEPSNENEARLRKNMHGFTDDEIYTKCRKIAEHCITNNITNPYERLNVFNEIIENELMYDKFSDKITAKISAFAKQINAEDYRFLDDTVKTHEPILIGFGGSIAHGTNIETSDIDIKGAAMLSPEEILLGRDFGNIAGETTDTTIYSLPKLVKHLTRCHPTTIEILGLKPEHYLYKSEIGEELLKKKDMFLSNRCIDSFVGYANEKMDQLRQTTPAAIAENDFNEHIASVVNDKLRQLKIKQYHMQSIEAAVKDGKIVLNASAEDCPVEDLSAVIDIVSKTVTNRRKLSARNRYALDHGKIAKHSMHLLRLYMMAEDLLLDGKVITYREKEHDLLMSIRNGKYLDEEGKPNKEFFDIADDYRSRFDYAKTHSVLPDEPDLKRIDNFMIWANYQAVQKGMQSTYGESIKTGV